MHARAFMFAIIGFSLATPPALARAQGGDDEAPRDLTAFGEYILLGGGATKFSKDVAKDRFDAGGSWDARVGIGNRFYVGAEAGYVGATLGGVGAQPDLTMNGVEGVVRVQYPYAAGKWLVEPFAFGGIGWNHVALDNAPSGVNDSDEVGVVPFGAGLGIGYDRLLLDARFTYRTSFNEDLAFAPGAAAADLQRWQVGASIGYEF